MNREHYANTLLREITLLGNTIKYLRYDNGTVKNKYGESKRKDFLPPIELKAIVRFKPTEEELEAFGIDRDNAEILVKIPTQLLIENNLTVNTDDKLEVNGELYFITDFQGKGTLDNAPMLMRVTASRKSDNRGK